MYTMGDHSEPDMCRLDQDESSSNLPCFHVQFAADADRKAIPSALHASDMILNELQSNGVVINRFTLIGWTG